MSGSKGAKEKVYDEWSKGMKEKLYNERKQRRERKSA